jgi:hypothetical protein
MSFQMDSTPVFSLTRHRELLAAAVQQERQRIIVALEIEANTIGGAVGAALRSIAEQVQQVQSARAPRAAPSPATPTTPAYDPVDDENVPFADLSLAQQARRSARRQREIEQATERMAQANREENARIERDRQRMKELVDSGQWNPDTDEPLQSPYGDRV